MAKSRFEYVKQFEQHDCVLPETFFVVRLDGRAFTKFCDAHRFEKPNDLRALGLMNSAALEVCAQFRDVLLAFGESDEYSFAFDRATTLFGRRREKVLSAVVSLFTAAYVRHFPAALGELRALPSFDGRVVCLPTLKSLRDYFAWRQVDTHVNNLYNTCFWALVQGGQSAAEAEKTLRHTLSDFKNELLFGGFGVNYNALPAIFRKGSVVVRTEAVDAEKAARAGERVDGKTSAPRAKTTYVVLHEDIIGDKFWEEHVRLEKG